MTTTPTPSPCLICGKTAPACDCSMRLGPFELILEDGLHCGSFTHADLAQACYRVLKNNVKQKAFLYDRHGLPVSNGNATPIVFDEE